MAPKLSGHSKMVAATPAMTKEALRAKATSGAMGFSA
jgi:hypothetical protein